MAVFSPADAATPAEKFLSREEAAPISSGVFLLNPASQQHLRSANKGRSIITILVLLALGIAAVICVGSLLLSVVSGNGTDRGFMLVFTVGAAALFGGGFLLIRRAYRRSIHIPADRKFLQGTLVSASSRERSTGTKIARGVLVVFVILVELLAAFSGNSSSTGGGWNDDDFYEVTVAYTAVTPSGTTINGTSKQNRPDLRKMGLPAAGMPVLVSYKDDTHFEML